MAFAIRKLDIPVFIFLHRIEAVEDFLLSVKIPITITIDFQISPDFVEKTAENRLFLPQNERFHLKEGA